MPTDAQAPPHTSVEYAQYRAPEEIADQGIPQVLNEDEKTEIDRLVLESQQTGQDNDGRIRDILRGALGRSSVMDGGDTADSPAGRRRLE